MKNVALSSVLGLALASFGEAAAQSQMPVAVYAKAEQRFASNASAMVLRDKITPQWIAGSDRFWYRVTTEKGSEFLYVDPAKKVRRPAFDHTRLATALAKAADTSVVADSLPFQTLTWLEEGKATRIDLSLRGKSWRCDLGLYRCDTVATPKAADPSELKSPNGKWALFLRDHNLWIRNTATDERRALTTDGAVRNDYAANTESNTSWVTSIRAGAPAPPIALWSADSKRFLTQKIDQRRVPESYLVQAVHNGGVRPKLWPFAFPMPGDSVGQATWWIFEPESGRATQADAPALPAPFGPSIGFQEAWWADSAGTTAYYLEHERGVKAWWLKAIDAATGKNRVVAEERGPTLAEATLSLGTQPLVRVTRDRKEVIWFSERDGWPHLYLMDAATGRIKNQITRGEWVVRSLVKIDDQARKIWFTAGGREPGRDPYFEHLYSIGFDGIGLTLLSPEDAEHQITLTAGGNWVVDRYSRQDLAPVTVARSLDGKAVLPLEQADVSRLLATGWRWPERFTAKAADGVTEVYGVIFKPAGFDSTRKYPVIEEIYPGPQTGQVRKAFEPGGDHRALVELGMVGVEVDGRGTPFRSKAFHNYSYGHLENGGGLEDHLAAYKQIAATRPYLDLDRVGIYGHSGGGFASARAMFLYPDFYKVAVSSAGNHDQRGYLSLWGETYNGMPNGDNYAAQANPSIAKNLKGKLMLVFGDMDDNVPPALTIQVIDALTKANKNYDLMIVPNGSHAMMANMYFRRRRWDYFVQHLVGQTPPADYQIKTPAEYPPIVVGTQP